VDKNQQKQERTEFHNLVFWGKRGEALSPYLTKGKLVFIEGELRTSSWVGQDNQKKFRTEVFVKNLQFGPRATNDGAFASPRNDADAEQKDTHDEEIPTIQVGSEDSPFEEDLEGDEIPF
jgi:single-strand DNA-binding protein